MRASKTGDRTVEMSFSSEAPALRWFGYEVLSHAPGAVRLDRMNAGAALLMDHNWADQVGVVKSVEIGADGVGRCSAMFGRGVRATEINNDVNDEIRTCVSVGYIIHAAEKTGVVEGVEVWTVTDWEPYEVSIVSVPMDISVGIGRDANALAAVERLKSETIAYRGANTMKIYDEHGNEIDRDGKIVRSAAQVVADRAAAAGGTRTAEPTTTVPQVTAQPDTSASRANDTAAALQAERQRVAEINAIGGQHGLINEANEAARNGTTVDAFTRSALAIIAERSQANPVTETRATTPGGSGQPAGVKPVFRSFGEFLQSVALAETTQGRQTDPRLLEFQERAATGMNESIGSDGGYLVQPTFVAELLKTTYDSGDLLKRVTKLPLSVNSNRVVINGVDETSRATGSRWGGVRVFRDKEAGTVNATKPKFREIELKLNKLTGLCYATEESLQDAALLQAIIFQAFASEFAWQIEDELHNGTGSGEMLGIFKSDALVSVAKETGQATATIVPANITKMWARLHPKSRKNAVWVYNQMLDSQLPLMVVGNIPIYMPPGGLNDTGYGNLLGRPMIPTEYSQPLGSQFDIALVDYSQYLYVDRGEMTSASSIHVNFVSGETAFRFTMRNDGQPAWYKPLTPAKGGDTLSPFVTLDARP